MQEHRILDDGAFALPKILSSKTRSSVNSDDKKKGKLILLGVLVVVFLYLLVTTFMPKDKPTTSQPLASPAHGSHAAPALMGDALPDGAVVFEKQPFESIATKDYWKSSPFSLEATEGPVVRSRVRLKLEGIVSDGNEAVAVINEKVVKKGDAIADNIVKEIRSHQVVLTTHDGEELIIEL